MEIIVKYIRWFVALPFFSRPNEPLSYWQIVVWWEVRRLFFNIIVGITGIASSALCIVSAIIAEKYLGTPIGLPDPPIFAIFAVIAYGVAANICYTLGWVVEIFVKKVWAEQGEHFGKISFTLGLVLSVVITLVPGGLIVLIVGYKLLVKALI